MIFVRRSSLSWKILLGIVPVLLVALSVSVVLQNRFQESEMMNQAQVSAHTYADLLRESLVSMMVNSQAVDTTFLTRVRAIQQFDSLSILANDLRLRKELLDEEELVRVEHRARATPREDTVQANVLKYGTPVYVRDGSEFRAVIPFNATKVCQRCHAVPVDYTLGAADLRFSLSRFSDAAADNWKRSVSIFLVFSVVAIGIAIVVFKGTIGKRIDRLVRAAVEIRKGNLRTLIPVASPGKSQDELEVLAGGLDEMRESLADKIARLDRVNSDLSRRNTELEAALDQLHTAQVELLRSERLAATGKMAAQLSHEINNPIHNTRSLLESSLRRVDDNGEARELIGLALGEVTRMATLTRQLLDVYRGSLVDPVVAPVDLRALLLDMGRANRDMLQRVGITLEISTADPLPFVNGSGDKLKQVVLNLMLNARDAMPEGGTVSITAQATDGWMEMRVTDTGTGIPPEYRDKIFDAFFTTKKEVSGVGLGLAVTYGIITQYKGSIEVDSTVGRGTTFIVRLPLMPPTQPEQDHGRN
jgi:signal transduction histidine kinase